MLLLALSKKRSDARLKQILKERYTVGRFSLRPLPVFFASSVVKGFWGANPTNVTIFGKPQ
jgi:hypothetical protein